MKLSSHWFPQYPLLPIFAERFHTNRIGLYGKSIINLDYIDFHTIPHFGDQSVLQGHWAGGRNRRMNGALILVGQDANSKLILQTATDIQRSEAATSFYSF